MFNKLITTSCERPLTTAPLWSWSLDGQLSSDASLSLTRSWFHTPELDTDPGRINKYIYYQRTGPQILMQSQRVTTDRYSQDEDVYPKTSTHVLPGVVRCPLQMVHLSFGGHVSSNRNDSFLFTSLECQTSPHRVSEKWQRAALIWLQVLKTANGHCPHCQQAWTNLKGQWPNYHTANYVSNHFVGSLVFPNLNYGMLAFDTNGCEISFLCSSALKN